MILIHDRRVEILERDLTLGQGQVAHRHDLIAESKAHVRPEVVGRVDPEIDHSDRLALLLVSWRLIDALA